MNSPDEQSPKGWTHWLGRIGVWVVGIAVGFCAGVLIGGFLQGATIAWAMVGLIGLSLVTAATVGSSLSLPARDLLFGLGLGQMGGAGFVIYILGALPNC